MGPWVTTIISALIATTISAVISGFIMARINKKLDIRQQEALEKEKNKERSLSEYNMLILRGIIASLSLGETTADTVDKSGEYDEQRSQARNYASKVKHDLQEFMYKQGQEHLK